MEFITEIHHVDEPTTKTALKRMRYSRAAEVYRAEDKPLGIGQKTWPDSGLARLQLVPDQNKQRHHDPVHIFDLEVVQQWRLDVWTQVHFGILLLITTNGDTHWSAPARASVTSNVRTTWDIFALASTTPRRTTSRRLLARPFEDRMVRFFAGTPRSSDISFFLTQRSLQYVCSTKRGPLELEDLDKVIKCPRCVRNIRLDRV